MSAPLKPFQSASGLKKRAVAEHIFLTQLAVNKAWIKLDALCDKEARLEGDVQDMRDRSYARISELEKAVAKLVDAHTPKCKTCKQTLPEAD